MHSKFFYSRNYSTALTLGHQMQGWIFQHTNYFKCIYWNKLPKQHYYSKTFPSFKLSVPILKGYQIRILHVHVARDYIVYKRDGGKRGVASIMYYNISIIYEPSIWSFVLRFFLQGYVPEIISTEFTNPVFSQSFFVWSSKHHWFLCPGMLVWCVNNYSLLACVL